MSSPMMTRTLGFCCGACAMAVAPKGSAAKPKTIAPKSFFIVIGPSTQSKAHLDLSVPLAYHEGSMSVAAAKPLADDDHVVSKPFVFVTPRPLTGLLGRMPRYLPANRLHLRVS